VNKEQLLLYAVTDRAWLNGDTLENAVEMALSGGVTMLQLREKNMPTEDFIKSARKIKSICEKFNVPLIINDNIDVVAAVDADGVHLGQGDTPLVEARRILGNDKIIGITAKTTEQALTAERNGADYLGSGAVFGTSTKSNAIKMELDTLSAITSAVNIPVVAIGGITADNAVELHDTGIAGAAVVSGIFAQNDIQKAAKSLLDKIHTIVN
jgi:thiamine-phosphate pyrophosphorylase/hydroxymethylpyrimidine kinase/phosphomethylpyrimidine kinase/thiamine-phosphate diphosphorylase